MQLNIQKRVNYLGYIYNQKHFSVIKLTIIFYIIISLYTYVRSLHSNINPLCTQIFP